MLSRWVITFLPRSKRLLMSWLQSPSAVILEPRKIKSATVSPCKFEICSLLSWSNLWSYEGMLFWFHPSYCFLLMLSYGEWEDLRRGERCYQVEIWGETFLVLWRNISNIVLVPWFAWESLGQQGDQTSQSQRKSVLNMHWKDWCWSWNSNTLATWCEELTHWKRPWSWEKLKAGGEEGNRGGDDWMASPTWWAWVRASSRNWQWTGKPGML